MKRLVLEKILQTLPSGADQIIVKGRRTPIIGASVPTGSARPSRWQHVLEAAVYQRPGFERWIWRGALDDTILKTTIKDLKAQEIPACPRE